MTPFNCNFGQTQTKNIMADVNKLKALDIAVGQIEKQHGKGTIMKLGDEASNDVDVISTGSIMVDYALGVQGVPRGRITEIYGPEASGKTTLALQVIAQAQKMVDMRHLLMPSMLLIHVMPKL